MTAVGSELADVETAPPAVADHALIERILAETGVERQPPSPGFADYMQTVAEAVLRGVADWLGALRIKAQWALEPLAIGLALSLLVVLVIALFLVLRRSRREAGAARQRRTPEVPVGPARSSPALDRQGWAERFEEHLSRGDVARALEAVWWWFARSVAGERVDPSWTSRELLLRCGRVDLLRFAGALDRMIYGAVPPRPDAVRALFGSLQEALP